MRPRSVEFPAASANAEGPPLRIRSRTGWLTLDCSFTGAFTELDIGKKESSCNYPNVDFLRHRLKGIAIASTLSGRDCTGSIRRAVSSFLSSNLSAGSRRCILHECPFQQGCDTQNTSAPLKIGSAQLLTSPTDDAPNVTPLLLRRPTALPIPMEFCQQDVFRRHEWNWLFGQTIVRQKYGTLQFVHAKRKSSRRK